ncbi:hypothetical protein [Clostridium gasigenes]|uniref:hypothetical protein n=1 Tax=Clostridium gasigenes TaxID=94869 RepID=UPI001C0C0F59|nr:hypothetical protein [Clostridium gasigenes]MBU3105072.1 hypothetical protein [Clostridium gasigenes]
MKSILIGGEDVSQQLLDIVKNNTEARIYNIMLCDDELNPVLTGEKGEICLDIQKNGKIDRFKI